MECGNDEFGFIGGECVFTRDGMFVSRKVYKVICVVYKLINGGSRGFRFGKWGCCDFD